MLTPIRLLTPDGHDVFLHPVNMLTMHPLPEVITWGTRVFTRVGVQEGDTVYREGMAFSLEVALCWTEQHPGNGTQVELAKKTLNAAGVAASGNHIDTFNPGVAAMLRTQLDPVIARLEGLGVAVPTLRRLSARLADVAKREG